MYKLIDLGNKSNKEMEKIFNDFYDKSIFTWEGMRLDVENLSTIEEMLELNNPTYYTFKGNQMNSIYNLTGDNRYPEDLDFLSIEDFYDPIKKLHVGARWFDDIVDNNSIREGN